MKKAGISCQKALMANHQSRLPAQPREGSFHDPSTAIASELPPVLMRRPSVIFTSGNHRFDSLNHQPFPQGVAVISLVSDQPIRPLAGSPGGMGFGNRHRRQSLVDQLHFRRRRRVQVCSQRSTRAIDQYHPLCSLATLGFPDGGPPFLAGAKLPSIKHSLHLIFSASLNWDSKARQSSSKTPVSSHSLKRRQQVLGLPYFAGSSLHGAPVHKIQRIPSKHRRSFARGRPPEEETDFFGSNGSIFAHWASDRSDLAML